MIYTLVIGTLNCLNGQRGKRYDFRSQGTHTAVSKRVSGDDTT